MRRTQVLLEDRQYHALRSQARREGKSMGQLIRELIDQALSGGAETVAGNRGDLKSLQGFIEDPGFDAKDHDRALYGEE